MAKKKGARTPKTYCSLAVWLSRNREDLWDALEMVCNQNIFHGRRRVMTFVCPDAKGEAALIALAESEGEKVRGVVDAHLVHGCYLKGSDWKAASDEGNLGTFAGLPLTVKGFTETSVTLSNDAVLKIEKGFRPMGDVRHAVWHLDSGAMPEGSGDFRYTRTSVKGGAAGPSSSAAADNPAGRKAAWHAITGKGAEYALRCGAGLLNYLFVHHNSSVYERVCATFGAVAHCPAATLFFLLEPFKSSGPYLVDWNVLEPWAGAPDQAVAPLSEYLRHLAHAHAKTADARRAYASALAGAINGPGLRAAAAFTAGGADGPAGAWRAQIDFICVYCYCEGDMAALDANCLSRPGNNYVTEAPFYKPDGSMSDGNDDASLLQFALSFIHDVDPAHSALSYTVGGGDFAPLTLGGSDFIEIADLAAGAGEALMAVGGGGLKETAMSTRDNVIKALKDGALDGIANA